MNASIDIIPSAGWVCTIRMIFIRVLGRNNYRSDLYGNWSKKDGRTGTLLGLLGQYMDVCLSCWSTLQRVTTTAGGGYYFHLPKEESSKRVLNRAFILLVSPTVPLVGTDRLCRALMNILFWGCASLGFCLATE